MTNKPDTQQTTEVYENFTLKQTQQTTFVDERASTVESGYLKGQASLPRNRKAITESPLSMLDCLKQPVLYKHLPWSVDSSRETILWSATIPGVFNTLSTIHKLPLQIYQFFRFTMKIKIVLNTTKFHAGKLILWWDPVNSVYSNPPNTRTSVVYHTDTLTEAAGYPNVVMNAKDSNVAELDIPWEHVLSTFSMSNNSLNTRVPLGTVRLQVLNPLRVPDTQVTDADVNIFISCVDLELNVPTRPHGNNFPTIYNAGNVIGGVKKGLSSATGAIADIATGNFSSGLDKIGATVGSVSGILRDFDLDKPSIPESKISNTLSTVSPQAHMRSADDTVRLGACPAAGYLETDFSNAPIDELMIKSVIQRPMLLGTVAWNSSDLADAKLLEIPVTPTVLLKADGARILLGNLGAQVVPTDGTLLQTYYKYYPTYLGYFSQMFEFWKGSIDFRFDFASTSFHTGRLQISFEPVGQPLPLDTTMSATSAFSSCPNQVFDLHETSSTKFKCDYVSMTPLKRVINPVTNPPGDDEQILGYLRIHVLTKLEKPEQLGDIEFNVYISGGEDFTLLCPRVNLDSALLADISHLPYDTPVIVNAGEVEGTMGDDAITRTSDTKDYPSAVKDGSLADNHDVFGERIETVLDLARRYCAHAEIALPVISSPIGLTTSPFTPSVNVNGDFASVSFLNSPTDPVVATETGDLFTAIRRTSPSVASFMRRLAPLYAFWSGSIRYQIIPYVDRMNPIMCDVTYAFSNSITQARGKDIPDGDWISILGTTKYNNFINSTYPRVTNLLAQDSAISVEIPFYSEMNQCLTNISGTTDSRLNAGGKDLDPWYTGMVQARFTAPSFGNSKLNDTAGNPVLPLRVNISAGDDFRFRYLIAPPVGLCRNPLETPSI